MADRDVIQALRAIKALALQHHGDEPPSALLHALLVEIPAECDSAIAALDAADARPVCRNCGHIDRLHDATPVNARRCNEPRCSCEDWADARPVCRGACGGDSSTPCSTGCAERDDDARPTPPAPADDASGAEAMRDDICKGCSTYEWCSVTGACLADSDPHDEGDWRRVVSTLTALAPLPPTADAVERARREEAYAKTFGQMLARDICESEPSGAVIDAQDRLKGTEAETFLVIDPRDLAEWVQRNVSNAFYDGEITIAAEREAGRDGKGG